MDSKINEAHYLARKADRYLKSKKFEDSRNYHLKTVKLLKEALVQSPCPVVTESLLLQIDDHKRQIGIIRLKEKYYKLVQSKINLTLQIGNKDMDSNSNAPIKEPREDEFFRNYEELMERWDDFIDIFSTSKVSSALKSINQCKGEHDDLFLYLGEIENSVQKLKKMQDNFKAASTGLLQGYENLVNENRDLKEKLKSLNFDRDLKNNSVFSQFKPSEKTFSPCSSSSIYPILPLEEPCFDLSLLQYLEKLDSK